MPTTTTAALVLPQPTRAQRAVARVLCLLLGTSPLLAACSSPGTAGAPAPAPPASADEAGAATPAPDASTWVPAADAGSAGAYSIEYLAPTGGLHVGRADFQIKLATRADGKPATGLAASLFLRPVMKMSMMEHGAPVPTDAVRESATAGTYDCTLYLPMASIDASGAALGQWSVTVAVGAAEAGTLILPVARAAGTDTTHVMLKHTNDRVKSGGGGGDTPRSYPLFRDALTLGADGRATFGVFVATIQEGNMTWPPVRNGLELVDAAGKVQLTVRSFGLEASTDGVTWTALVCDTTSRCAGELTGLARGTAGKVYVKLAVNGLPYTTDGAPPDPEKSNGFATFAVTP